MLDRLRNTWADWAIDWIRAALIVAVPTVALALLRDYANAPIPTLVLIVPLAAAGWRGGVSDAVVAAVVLFEFSNYLDVPPYYQFKWVLAEVPRFVLILSMALLSAARGRAEQRRLVRAAHQSSLARIARHAMETRELPDTLRLVTDVVAETLQVPLALVVGRDDDDRGRLLAARGLQSMAPASFAWSPPEALSPSSDVSLAQMMPTAVPAELVSVVRSLGDRPSAAVATFALGGRTAGLLLAGAAGRRAFLAEELEWLQSAAYVVAAAVDRAHLDDDRLTLLASERAARQEAEHANRLKDEFLATLSHELRTPLNVVMGWVAMLRDSAVSPGMRERAVSALERNAQAQCRLVQDLLDLSQIMSGALRIEMQLVDMPCVVQAAMDTMQSTATAKAITLDLAPHTTGALVLGDPVRLQQVTWNLLSNALKFTPPGGTVRVAIGADAETVTMDVIDTGVGIATGFLPHVFERFSQADSSPTRRHGGLGLGLALVRHLVEMHGGAVRAYSDGEGRGSTFTVRLPLARGPAPAAAAGAPSPGRP